MTTGISSVDPDDPQVAKLLERLEGLDIDPILQAHGVFRLSRTDARLIVAVLQATIREALEPMRRAAEGKP